MSESSQESTPANGMQPEGAFSLIEHGLTGVVAGEVERKVALLREGGWKSLDPDRATYVLAYIENSSHASAAKSIGKDLAYANKMRSDPLVSACISDVQEVMLRERVNRRAIFEAKSMELLEKAMGERPVQTVVDGAVIETELDNLSVAKATLEMIAKSEGMIGSGMGGSGKGKGGVLVNINFGKVDGSTVPKEITVIEAGEDE